MSPRDLPVARSLIDLNQGPFEVSEQDFLGAAMASRGRTTFRVARVARGVRARQPS
jgi:hypothetical protein